MLGAFGKRLRDGDSPAQKDEERELSEAHGRHRWQQGYDLRGMLREWRHLNATLVGWLGENETSLGAHLSWAEFVALVDRWFIEISDTGEGLETSSAAPLAQNLESAAPGASTPTISTQASNRLRGGEGIGLAIVRRLCELLDASIELNSTEAGSTFRVTFPRALKHMLEDVE